MPIIIHPNKRLYPENQRLPNVATQRLNQVAPLIQQQYKNALQVNGIQYLLYSQILSGQPCTCSALHGEKYATSALNEDGTAPQSMIDQLLLGGQFGIIDYARQVTRANDPTPDPIVQDGIERSLNFFGEGSLLSDPIAENIEDIPIQGNQQQFNDGESGACHVCMGTGYVGGYTLTNGLRALFNPQSPNVVLYKSTADTLVSPYEVESLSSDAYFQFSITLPKTTLAQVHRLKLWRNGLVEPCTFYHVNSNSSLTIVDYTNLNAYCDGAKHTFQVKGYERFSHVEVQLYYGDIEYLDSPTLTKTANLGQLESLENITVNLSASIPLLKAWDILADMTYGKLWRVENTPTTNDSRLNVYGWSCSTRLVQNYEILGSLYTGKPLDQKSTLEPGVKPAGNKLNNLPGA